MPARPVDRKKKGHIKRHKLPSSLYNDEQEQDYQEEQDDYEQDEYEEEGGRREKFKERQDVQEQARKRGISKVSFDVLSKVQDEYEEKYKSKRGREEDSDDEGPEESGFKRANNNDSEDDGPPEESGFSSKSASTSRGFGADKDEPKSLKQIRLEREAERQKLKRAHKHAPSESTFKRRVGVIRDIPGLEPIRKAQTEDIRFDTVYGKADLEKARKNYEFLDEYRKDEIKELKNVLRDAKRAEKMNQQRAKRAEDGDDDDHEDDDDEEYNLPTMTEWQKEDIKRKIQSLEGQLVTMKRRDFENEVVKKYQQDVKTGARDGPKFLKRSDKRKLVLAEQFKTMKKKDVSKSLERKRKRNLAKERKTMPTERRG